MTQQIPLPSLSLSSRQWNLHPLQPLSASVRLVHDITTTPPTPYALKTVTLPSQTALDQTLREATIWQHISHPSILKLHDVFQHNQTVSFLMEYCPTGPLNPRPEPLALRAVSSIAAALDYFLSLGHSAHANISTSHVLLDARGAVKLAGFGYTRARRLASRPKLNQLDDVRALGAVLFELITARVYDPDNSSLPSSISHSTALLIKNVLYVKSRHVPQLMVFRYELAAARGLVPVTQASSTANDKSSAHATPAPRGSLSNPASELTDKATRELVAAPGSDQKPALAQVSSETAIELVKAVTADRTDPIPTDDVDQIVRACATEDGLPEKVFKFLFTLPISKNPVVAFNTITLLHYLLAEGPAKLTALAITHDGFLNWAESSWTRGRIQNKSGKVHDSVNSFSGGEIAWYMALLRKRIVFHAKFAQVLSTHWVPRPDGLASLGTARTAAVKSALEIVQSCGIYVRTILSSRDLLAPLKKGSVPAVVSDLAKAYLAICWFYATSDDQTKHLLNHDFSVAHNSTRLAMEAVRVNADVAEMCASNFLLELKDDVPVNLDSQAVTSALKKKKKKKKKKVPTATAEKAKTVGNGETSDGDGDDSKVRQVKKSPAPQPFDYSGEEEGEQGHIEPDEMPKKRGTRGQNGRRVSPPELPAVVVAKAGEAALNGGGSPPIDSGVSNGLQKLSLDVRRAGPRANARLPPRTAPRMAGGYGVSPNRMTSPYPDNGMAGQRLPADNPTPNESNSRQRVSTVKRVGALKPPNSGADRNFNQSGRHVNDNGHVSYHGVPVRRRATERRDYESSGSESESSDDDMRKSSQRRKVKSGKRESRKRSDSDSSDSDTDNQGDVREKDRMEDKRRTRKVVSKPKSSKLAADERKIPFDKEHPKRPARLRKAGTSVDDAEYRGGSREALAAAASGKKTPSINPKFEVAPYEVQFGPQIGSGGFGVVFKAKFRTETVAIKKIHAHALSNANSVAEFQSEVAVLCTLRHPNILRFVGACTKPPNLMIITEFMARGTLFDLLHQSQTRVTWPMRKKFALDTCKGMRYLHDSKLLHRDLKSSNLMLDKDFNCKVGDFGLTRISRGTAAVQMTGQCGTFQYMAVEVLANKPYSEKADVFSFGILLWEVVARKLPYFGMQPMQVAIAVLQQGMRPPMPPKCPVPLAKLMRACWDSDPNRRPSFAQLVEALEAMPE